MSRERQRIISSDLQAYLDSMPDHEIKPDYISRLPRLDIPDETQLGQVYIQDVLREVSLTTSERRTVERALDIASCVEGGFGTHWVTVGEIRAMSDRELLKLKKRNVPYRVHVEKIDPRRVEILRALFGRLFEENEIEEVIRPQPSFLDRLDEANLQGVSFERERLSDEPEYISRIPQLPFPDEMKLTEVRNYMSDHLRGEHFIKIRRVQISMTLTQAGFGLNRKDLTPTVGSIRQLSDEELSEIEAISPKRTAILRALFGRRVEGGTVCER